MTLQCGSQGRWHYYGRGHGLCKGYVTCLLKQKRPEIGQLNQELLTLNPELLDDQLLLKLFSKINKEISKKRRKVKVILLFPILSPSLHPEVATCYYICFSLLVDNISILVCNANELFCTLSLGSFFKS